MGLSSGAVGRVAVPSGASTGAHEALELRDGDPSAFGGRSVLKAVANVEDELAGVLVGREAAGQAAIDRTMIELDGTPNKARLGANAILAFAAVAAAAASDAGLPWRYIGGARANRMPVPLMNILNGGARGQLGRPPGVHGGAGRGPHPGRRGEDGRRGLLGAEVDALARARDRGGGRGRLRARSGEQQAALEVIMEAISATGYAPGQDVALALDPATASSTATARTTLDGEARARRSRRRWSSTGPSSWGATRSSRPRTAWRRRTGRLGEGLTERLGGRVPARRGRPVRDQHRPAAAGDRARCGERPAREAEPDQDPVGDPGGHRTSRAGRDTRPWSRTRSGGPRTPSIADLAVATEAGQIKTGAPSRAAARSRCNQLIRIEEQLGPAASYPGRSAFRA